MGERPKYKTKQMTELVSYMKSTQGHHVTVSDISAHFKEKGISVGMTTIYRHLESMVEEGIVAKYIIDENSSACFEYLGEEEHSDKINYYHCKCEKCGKLIHLECDEVDHLIHHLNKDHGFTMDPMRTVFYGICSECKNN